MRDRDLDHEPTPHLPVWEMIRREEAALRGGLDVELYAVSHTGRRRENNEDHYLALRIGRSLEVVASNLQTEELPARLERSGFALMVADGIGGRAAGELASRRALQALVEVATRVPDWILEWDKVPDADLVRRANEYFSRVNDVLESEALADPALRGMGTTMTVVYLLDEAMLVAHVGDSRAYRFRGGRLERLTHDQTMAQALADAGVIAEADVASHRQRHVLTGALGASGGAPRVEFGRHDLVDGDRILLASDGLSGMLPDDAIAHLLSARAGAREGTEALVEAALAAGGDDNVTVVLANCALLPVKE